MMEDNMKDYKEFFKQFSMFKGKFPSDKIRINHNKNPIKMDLFLSFLTVDVVRSRSHLGCDNGWTKLMGAGGLIVTGGIVVGVEYLEDLQYGQKLDNIYNNYVPPFYLFEILNSQGRRFFINYYADEIDRLVSNAELKLKIAEEQQQNIRDFLTLIEEVYDGL